MKSKLKPAILYSAIALCMGLTSCVDPYSGYSSTSITTYSSGHRLSSLPRGYRTETISGSTYYYNNGQYYRSRPGGYVVVDAPRSSRYYSDYNRQRNSRGSHNTQPDRNRPSSRPTYNPVKQPNQPVYNRPSSGQGDRHKQDSRGNDGRKRDDRNDRSNDRDKDGNHYRR